MRNLFSLTSLFVNTIRNTEINNQNFCLVYEITFCLEAVRIKVSTLNILHTLTFNNNLNCFCYTTSESSLQFGGNRVQHMFLDHFALKLTNYSSCRLCN